ncbi:MAG: hypothetical protein ABFE07_25615 [Armatimonadia bacterium]
MKKFLTSNLIWFAVFGVIIASIQYPEIAGFGPLAVMMLWILILLGLASAGGVIDLLGKAQEPDEDGYDAAVKDLLKLAIEFKSRSAIRRGWRWLQVGVMTVTAGFAGMPVSGIAYLIVSVICWAVIQRVNQYAKEQQRGASLEVVVPLHRD